MNNGLFRERMRNFARRGEMTAAALTLVAEALDTVASLRARSLGTETVRTRRGEFKQWDQQILRIDTEVEDGFRARLAELGVPCILLSEEAGRVAIGRGRPRLYAVADPFDGSWLFQRGIPHFWYCSIAFYDAAFEPLSCAVGDAVHRRIAFADRDGAWVGALAGRQLRGVARLDMTCRDASRGPAPTALAEAGIESYAMKPGKFLLPLVDRFRPVVESFKFLLPNGGPNGFVDVAEGKVDVYFAPGQPFVDVFSGIQIAERAGAVVTDFEGNPVRADARHKTLRDVVASANAALHEQVLKRIALCR